MKYKVGDRVKMRSLQWCKENIFNNEDKYPPELFRGIEKFCGKILTVSDAVDKSKYLDEGYYNMDEDTEWDYYWTDEMIEGLVEEETKPKYEDEVSGEYYSTPKYLVRPSGYQFKDENGNVINTQKIVLEKKNPKYPKTWEECCNYLGIPFVDLYMASEDCKNIPIRVAADIGKVIILNRLIICRDAYWKIAGEEMGLGKPWKPDWTNQELLKYCIANVGDQIKTSERYIVNTILAFPTKEMRDAFYENFKELIESVKELL